MIDFLNFNFGSKNETDNLKLKPSPITIFVGPNNSGKSRALIEIENYCRNGKVSRSNVIFNDIKLSPQEESIFREEVKKLEIKPDAGENIKHGHTVLSKLKPQTNEVKKLTLDFEQLVNEATSPDPSKSGYVMPLYPRLLDIFTLRLDGTNRLNLLKEKDAGDLQKTAQNNLAQLFKNDFLRKQLRDIVYEAFGKYLVVDPTHIGKLRIRLSDIEPVTNEIERGWGEDSVNFHKKGMLVSNASDGVKAFCGILSTIIAGDPKVLLIDEPEAFLHPSLSNLLGKEIGKSLSTSNRKLFSSTHSSSFLMGCIQSNAPLDIVRLTYKDGNATARLLPKEKIVNLMRNPLLRSTGVLNGLFYDSVIVTEADSDRAFYQEINERLLAENDPRGIQNCLFLNAQNKQTIWDIVKPLRELGIPSIGIVDLDVVKEGGSVFSKLLKGAFIPELSHSSLNLSRKSIYDSLQSVDTNWKRTGGLELLPYEEKQSSNDFIDNLKSYGVFIVKNGELESWLKYLDVKSNKSTWLLNMFIKMGDNPESMDYVKPNKGDVWEFISDIKQWITNNERKGIPK